MEFHVADDWFDGASAAHPVADRSCRRSVVGNLVLDACCAAADDLGPLEFPVRLVVMLDVVMPSRAVSNRVD